MSIRNLYTEKHRYLSCLTRVFACACLLSCHLHVSAQLKLSNAGAMAALNGSTSTAPAPSSLSPISVPITPPSVTTPVIVGNQMGLTTQPNDKVISVAYQSALCWWPGYFDFRTATYALDFPTNPIDLISVMAGVFYIQADNSFVFLQNYNQRRATMIIRANEQSPVHVPKASNIGGSVVQMNAYTPTISNFSVNVPVKFGM